MAPSSDEKSQKKIQIPEAAKLSGYSKGYLSYLCRTGKILGTYSHNEWSLNLASLEGFMRGQSERKEARARSLANSRALEYQSRHVPSLNASDASGERPPDVLAPPVRRKEIGSPSLFFKYAAGMTALAVITLSALAADALIPPIAARAASITKDAALGFTAAFSDMSARIAMKVEEARTSPSTRFHLVLGTDIRPFTLTQPDLSALRMKVDGTPSTKSDLVLDTRHVTVAMEEIRADTLPTSTKVITAGDLQTFAHGAYQLLTSPSNMFDAFFDTLMDAHVALGERAYAAIVTSFSAYRSLIDTSGERSLTLAVSFRDTYRIALAPLPTRFVMGLGSAVINAAHAAIRADVSLAYGLSHAAPESARTLVTLLGDTGDALARITSRTPALAASFFLKTTALPSELAPGIAQAVFDVEYEGAERFLALAGTAAHASLASFSATARLAHDSLAFLRAVPPALDDAYLGALGKGALALDKATSPLLAAVLPKLSYAEQLALATYETIHGLFDSANRMLALLLGPPPTIVLSTTPPARSALTILSASSTPTTYTTIVQGISSSFLDQSLATLRADIIATVVGMVNPVAAEVNPIYRYSEARPFDGGAIANSITSPSFSASEADGTSSFALLSAGTTTVTNLTVSNTSTSTFAGPLTTSRFLSSTLGSAASPAFTFLADTTTGLFSPAASTLALSTAGAERLRIDADGNIGIGTTSPDALLSLQQVTNGTPFVSAYRVTDTVPSGDFISYKQNDGTTLFRVDNSGNLLAGGIINSGSQTITSASTPQFRIQYDPSNEITFSTGLTGTTTIGLTGSSPGLVLTPQSNSTNSFNFTDAASDSVLSIDTVNKRVGIGTTTPVGVLSIAKADSSGVTDLLVNPTTKTTGDLLDLKVGGSSLLRVNSGGAVFGTGSIQITYGSVFKDSLSGNFYMPSDGFGSMFIANNAGGGNGNIQFQTLVGSLLTRMVITAQGQVGIGSELNPVNALTVDGALSVGNSSYNVTAPTNGAIIQGNVGIGTTSPFAKLSVHANNGDTNQTLFAIASSTATATTTHFVVTNGGNVGVGTTTPFGRLAISSSGSDNLIRIENTVNSTFGTDLVFSGKGFADKAFAISLRPNFEDTVGDLAFYRSTNGVTFNEAMRIQNSSGNVGIGTTTPGAKLHVEGGTSGAPFIAAYLFNNTAYSAGSAVRISFAPSSNYGPNPASYSPYIESYAEGAENKAGLTFATYNGSGFTEERMRIRANGNVGIGTTSPTTRLHVVDSNPVGAANAVANQDVLTVDSNTYAYINLRSPSAGADIAGGVLFSDDTRARGGVIYQHRESDAVSDRLDFLTSAGTRMSINSSGLVGIGTTSPNHQLTLSGNQTATIGLYSTNAQGGERNWAITTDSVISGDFSLMQSNAKDGNPVSAGTSRLYIAGAGADIGNVGIGTTSPQGLLDIYNGKLVFSDADVNGELLTHIGSYGRIEPLSGTAGGMYLQGESDTDAAGMLLAAQIGSTDPADTTPAIYVSGSKWDGSGTGGQALASTETVFRVDNYLTTGLVTVLGSGNVGIGAAAPGVKLDVIGTSADYQIARVRGTGAGVSLGYDASGNGLVGNTAFGSVITITPAGNVGIGTADTATYKVNVNGSLNATEIRVNGTVLNPGTGSNWTVSGSDVYRLAGNVGIGTSTPQYTLSVAGGMQLTGASANVSLRMQNYGSGGRNWRFIASDSAETLAGGFGLFDDTANAYRLAIGTSGNVGIGTTSPFSKLGIVGPDNLSATDYLQEIAPSGTEGIGFGYQNIRKIGSSANSNLVIDAKGTGNLLLQTVATGNVGIGTTTPDSKLSVVSASAVGIKVMSGASNAFTGLSLGRINYDETILAIATAGVYSDFSTLGDSVLRASAEDLILDAHNASGAIRFGTGASGSNTEKMTITNAGNVGIGTTSPNEQLTVKAGTAPKYALGLYTDTDGRGLNMHTSDYVSGSTGSLLNITFNGGTGNVNAQIDTLTTGSTVAGNLILNQSGGNVGIGTTSPAGVDTFAKLDIYGTGRTEVNVTGAGAGAGAVGGYRITATSTTGAYTGSYTNWNMSFRSDTFGGAAGALAFYGDQVPTGSLLGMSLIPNGASNPIFYVPGNVGIGTTSPKSPLHIENADSRIITFDTDGVMSASRPAWVSGATGAIYAIGSIASYSGTLTNDITTRFVIDASGNVGIGTTSPSGKLHVSSSGTHDSYFEATGGSSVYLHLKGSNKEYALWNADSVDDSFRIHDITAGQTRFAIDSSGNVGIGTTSPGGRGSGAAGPFLNLEASGTNLPEFYIGNSTTTSGGDLGTIGFYGGSSGSEKRAALIFGELDASSVTNPYGRLSFWTANNGTFSERMRIDSSGNVGIGTTDTSTYKVNVNGSLNATEIRVNGTVLNPGTGSNWTVSGSDVYRLAGNVGIGTTSPDQPLTVVNNGKFLSQAGGSSTINLYKYSGTNAYDRYSILFSRARGTLAAPTVVSAGDHTGTIEFQGYDGSAYDYMGGVVMKVAAVSGGVVESELSFDTANQTAGTGATRMTIDKNGNVGIGTTSPSSTLHVNGSGRFTPFGGSDARQIVITTPGGTDGGITFSASSSDATTRVDIARVNGDLAFALGSGTLEKMRITSSGNVGIGTTSPSNKLTIYTGNIANANEGISLTRGAVGAAPDNVFGMRLKSDASGNYRGAFTITSAIGGSETEALTVGTGGNVGIGTTSPALRLHVQDTSTTNQAIFGRGTVLGDSRIYIGESTSADKAAALTYVASGNYLSLDVSGDSNSLVVANGGNVGIGTTTPGAALDVRGSGAIITNRSNGIALNVAAGDGYLPEIDASLGSATSWIERVHGQDTSGLSVTLQNGTTDNIAGHFQSIQPNSSRKNIGLWVNVQNSAGSAYSAIFENGNVGIGTTSPTTKLHVLDTATDSSRVAQFTNRVDANSEFTYIGVGRDNGEQAYIGHTYNSTDGNRYAWFGVSGDGITESGTGLIVKKGGNVGIGTTSPSQKLHVSASASGVNNLGDPNGIGTQAVGIFEGSGQSGIQIAFPDVQQGNIYFSSPSKSVNASIVSSYNVGSPYIAFTTNGTTERMRIDSSGGVTLSGYLSCTGFTSNGSGLVACTASDERLKQNIAALDGASALAGLNALNPVSFYWNPATERGSSQQYGLIAQQVQSVFPNLVTVTNPTSLTPDGTLSVDYQGLISPMVLAIQQLDARTKFIANAASSTVLTVGDAGDIGVGTSLAGVSAKLAVSGNVFATSYETANIPATSFTLGSTTLAAQIPSAVLTALGSVDLYKLATYNLSGISALALALEEQEARITSLESRVAALESGAITSTSGTTSLSTTSLTDALNTLGVFIKSGLTQFGTLVADRFVAAADSAGTASAGTVTILAGNTIAKVNNAYVTPMTKVFITFTAPVTGSWYISDKKKGSFKVVLASAQTADASFDYFLVQTEGQMATTTTTASGPSVELSGGTTSASQTTTTTTPLETSTALTGQATTTTTATATSTPSSDTTPPTVTLIGDAAMQITTGSSFTDPGATAVDDTDGDLTAHITVSGTVDITTAGLYTLTYSATDAAGNTGSASRVVTVADTTTSSSGSTSTTDTTTAPTTDTTTTSPTTTDTTTTSTDTTSTAPTTEPAPEPTPSA